MSDPETTSEVQESSETDTQSPIILDLGRQKRKQVRRLRKGRGKLVGSIQDLVGELKEEGAIESNAQPVIVVVREKRRRMDMARWF